LVNLEGIVMEETELFEDQPDLDFVVPESQKRSNSGSGRESLLVTC
jgi:hypothetical protein